MPKQSRTKPRRQPERPPDSPPDAKQGHVALHLKHPPSGICPLKDIPNKLASLAVREDELGEDGMILSMAWKRFCQTNDPVALLETFEKADQCGIYPPLDVLKALARTFRQYLAKDGRESLDDLLGLKTGQGQAPWAKNEALKKRNEFIIIQIHLLRHFFELSTEEAATMVAAKLQCPGEDKTLWNGIKEPLSIGSLVGLYERRKKYGLKVDNWIEDYVATWSRQKKMDILRKFPRESWPRWLQNSTP